MKPKITQIGPYEVELKKDKQYLWCTCGRSKDQPFCDGSHEEGGIKPVLFKAEKTGKAYLCGCKHTKHRPYCDGTHETLEE